MKTPPGKLAALLALLAALLFISGCAGGPATAPHDPFEGANRAIMKFNLNSDRVILRPVAQAYEKAVPGDLRDAIGNFFSNLREPMTIVNDLLQGKFHHAAEDSMRFMLNSTAGMLGFIDLATPLDMPRRDEDFGQTLAVWGMPDGPYIVLPFFGPSNARDTLGLAPEWLYGDPLVHLESPEDLYAEVLSIVDARAQRLGFDEVLDVQPDKYLFIREAYRQQRAALVHDGDPPGADGAGDDLIDSLLESE